VLIAREEMPNRTLSVFLYESGQIDKGKTTRADIISPRDDYGDEIVVSVEADGLTIGKLVHADDETALHEKLKIVFKDL
tara:strand:+ start:162 stop:398 length:237 start_codon:yes stop_codon:yes gene_type:complete